MTEEELKNLKRAIIATSAYYDRQLTDDAVRMYVNDLQDLPYIRVVEAMRAYRLDSANRTMFLPAHIRAIINPKVDNKDLARVTALKIKQAVSRYGFYQVRRARDFIGEAGWTFVERYGGWEHLCQNLGSEIPESTFLAQARDAIESDLNLQKTGIDTTKPVIEQVEKKQLGGQLAALATGLTERLAITKEKTHGQEQEKSGSEECAQEVKPT